jgi:hypothetical protein
MGVAVGGTTTGVLVGGTGVLVAATGVLVAATGTEVLVGGTGVLVGGTGVVVGCACIGVVTLPSPPWQFTKLSDPPVTVKSTWHWLATVWPWKLVVSPELRPRHGATQVLCG